MFSSSSTRTIIRSVLGDSLLTAGCDVSVVAAGEEGLRSLEQRLADPMVVDLKIPGISGVEFAEQATKVAPDSEIIILTGYGDMKSALDAMRIGVYDYLTKPVDQDRLLQTLEKADGRRRLIMENPDLLRRLSEANRIKAEFINGMSHEDRTPLEHITGFAQILQDTLGNLTGKQQRYIENIQTWATRLLDLFEKILSFSTLKSGDVQVKPDPGNIEGIHQTAIDCALPVAADDGITLVQKNGDATDVVVDRKTCARALSLLLDNAIKFNNEGGRVVLGREGLEQLPEEIEVDARTAEGWLSIRVADTAIGIPED
ncbi:MAG: hypothetical protein CME19_06085 [Gemmatimonadetes bacterium]|nr:hypothetical protein [Gemmatimonadota bacterium]